MGRLQEIQYQVPGAAMRSLATYRHQGHDVNERVVSGTASGKTTVGWDAYKRIIQLKDQKVGAGVLSQFDYEYDVVDRLTKETYTRPSTQHVGGGDRYVYDEFGRVTQAWLGLNAASMAAPLDDNGSTFAQRKKYTLDATSNRDLVDIGTHPPGQGFSSFSRDYTVQGGASPVSNRYDTTNPGFYTGGTEQYLYDEGAARTR
ncbi:MAG: hypothetical protein H6837_12340 [Planctomycetes bacterium]|nr:hypothetical protein [Planctomycetota bacterium]